MLLGSKRTTNFYCCLKSDEHRVYEYSSGQAANDREKNLPLVHCSDTMSGALQWSKDHVTCRYSLFSPKFSAILCLRIPTAITRKKVHLVINIHCHLGTQTFSSRLIMLRGIDEPPHYSSLYSMPTGETCPPQYHRAVDAGSQAPRRQLTSRSERLARSLKDKYRTILSKLVSGDTQR